MNLHEISVIVINKLIIALTKNYIEITKQQQKIHLWPLLHAP
jgi:hypothetical protein